MLYEVLRSPTSFVSGPWALKVQIGAQEWHGLDAFLTLAQRWAFVADAQKCCKLVSELYVAAPRLSGGALDSETMCDLKHLLAMAEGELADGPVPRVTSPGLVDSRGFFEH